MSYRGDNLVENIKQALDNGYTGCGIFVDLKKTFDKVNYKTLISSPSHPWYCK